jgi:hypothetical protein
MSNTLAVATVTAALSRILSEALAATSPGGVHGVGVTTVRPDMLATTDGGARSVNLFLYQVVPDGNWMAADLPTRRPDGSLLTRPQQALDLRYLLTFSGDESALEPQRLLGLTVTTLAAGPVLSREVVRTAIAKAVHDDPTTWLQFSDLAEQVDVVRVTMQPMNLEELSKLWSTFPETAYRLSVTYQATVVLLESDVTPQPALPVRTRVIDVAPIAVPSIDRVIADASPTDPVVPGTMVRIEGTNLRGPAATLVRFASVAVKVPDSQVTESTLTVALPGEVHAGFQGVQIRHRRLVGSPPQERDSGESNTAPVLVHPVVAGPVTATGGTVTVPVDPAVGKRQQVVLLLNEHQPPADRPARAYTFAAPPLDPAGPEAVGEVKIPVSGVVAGTYLVRVQVDGADSVLGVGADGRYDSPWVTLP